jgi:hypothetical protein
MKVRVREWRDTLKLPSCKWYPDCVMNTERLIIDDMKACKER